MPNLGAKVVSNQRMKRTVNNLILVALLSAVTDLRAQNNSDVVRPIRPVKIEFDAEEKRVFLNDGNEELLKAATRFRRENVVLTHVIERLGRQTMYQKLEGGGFTSAFLIVHYFVGDVSGVKNLSELKEKLGVPRLSEGPVDTMGTFVFQWSLVEDIGGKRRVIELTTAATSLTGAIQVLVIRRGTVTEIGEE